jgi:glycosyltransferase involved in cell wall biosynthesis
VYEVRSLWEDAATERGSTKEGSLRYLATRHMETLLAQRVDAVACICDGLRHELSERGVGAERIHVVPNGVDVDRFTPRPPDRDTRDRFGFAERTVVGYIGSFFGFEGVVDLVEAIARLASQGRDDIAGLIVGAGETYEACREIAGRHGLADRIAHPGQVAPDAVDALYSAIDVLAYPRRSLRITELVTPLKPLEAMAMEKAVIGSDVGGIRELVQDGVTGLLYRAGSIDDLVAKVDLLVRDADQRRRLGQNGRQWVVTQRDWKQILPKYAQVYESAFAKRRRH